MDVDAAVLRCVARAQGGQVERLQQRMDADLMQEIGFDSLQLVAIWCELEECFALETGTLGATQAVTMRSIAEELRRIVHAGPGR